MTVAEQAGEDRVSPEPPAQPQTPQSSAKTLGAAPTSEVNRVAMRFDCRLVRNISHSWILIIIT